ncbi:unnamed protein product [Lactuca saligna]|uniref:GTD-binding domain-containing protein n=1 Tax=Lactuca saligna TaxID=75948 RepID=A0AA36E7S4_LACSI|nr:unnamed protein product [Lactuca saligna]
MNENNMNPLTAVEPTNNSLKEALCAQQRLLQKLYNELDVEREAAATAASEALSMILRLQGEKAAVKMEAEQYKRLAEEKMNHAEESFQVFEEIMYHKEMEIASLDYQVQAYRYKLVSLGIDDLGANEFKFPENLLQRNETLVGETSSDVHGITKKNTPPPKRLKLSNLKKGTATLKRDRSIQEDSDTIAKIVEESSREREDENNQAFEFGLKTEGSTSVDINSYLEQIRKLDKLVEEMAGEQNFCTFAKTSRSSSVRSKLNELDRTQSAMNFQKWTDEKLSSNTCSTSVHDVFEVPQIKGYEKPYEKDEEKSIKDDEKSKKLVAFHIEPVKSYEKEEFFSGKKPLLPKHKDKKVFLPGDGINVDCHMALFRHATCAAEIAEIAEAAEAETENETAEQNVRQEGQELRLLYEIRDKLNSIQSDIRSKNTKVNKSSPNCDLPMLQLREAMMHFWF